MAKNTKPKPGKGGDVPDGRPPPVTDERGNYQIDNEKPQRA